MARWNTNLYGQEVALYYSRSRWQSPDGFDPQTQQLLYPRLNTYGFSTRGEMGPGIFSIDAAYYQSSDDKEGDQDARFGQLKENSNIFAAIRFWQAQCSQWIKSRWPYTFQLRQSRSPPRFMKNSMKSSKP
jgi:hypothetical protein